MGGFMREITFIDIEVSMNNNKIVDFGAIKYSDQIFHGKSGLDFIKFIGGSEFICGHNILNHDMKYLKSSLNENKHIVDLDKIEIIDTLYLSALLFPEKKKHSLGKDEKIQSEEFNNPLNDAKKSKDLLQLQEETFRKLSPKLKSIYYTLLSETKEFKAFFKFIGYREYLYNIEDEITSYFHNNICSNVDLKKIIIENPVELAYTLALININYMGLNVENYIIPKWVYFNYNKIYEVMNILRAKRCYSGCSYCNKNMDPLSGLRKFFKFNTYINFDGIPLQEQAVKAALANKSILAIFPTGGGKSITFQVPALMLGENSRALTVIISPLQSLMKDQVDNLLEHDITEAATINGLLDPIERSKAIKRIEDGSANLLYISPESLRSKSIERLLLGRNIARFVIDEAHCFSAWGQDFRVDYLYIAEFIKNLCKKKNIKDMIPVSCLTATAKQNVIEDIKEYFKKNLNLDLEVFSASVSRKNIKYKVIEKDEKSKYDELRRLLEYKICPTIVYVSRTSHAENLSLRLKNDGYVAGVYHGKMNKNEKTKNQDAFKNGDIRIIVATSAFGMGVDKKDVGMVIHYDISDSLENYIQEAGRAGRNKDIDADCFVLFNDEDLNKHFILLNQTKISIQEIQQVWRAIKDATKVRSKLSNSALEIARSAGWDDNVKEIETRVKTAISALEQAGYIKRGQNMPRVFADSILAKSTMEARIKIHNSGFFDEKEEQQAVRIISKMISSRSRKNIESEVPETRVDYIADDLGIEKRKVIILIQKLREAKVLADAKDLVAYIGEKASFNRGISIFKVYSSIEKFLFEVISEQTGVVYEKDLNEKAEKANITRVTTDKIRTIINFWVIRGFIKREISSNFNQYFEVTWKQNKNHLKNIIERQHEIGIFILNHLSNYDEEEKDYLEFSVLELMDAYKEANFLAGKTVTSSEIENSLFYLSRIGALKIDGGFLVTYNALTIERLEMDNKIRYKLDDYRDLKKYYEQKTQMIHIVGEYAKKMMEDYKSALQFVEDYFGLEYSLFLKKYFKGKRTEEIGRNLSPEKFKRIFGELSPAQLKIINDKESQYIVVAAGPGSGKTRLLVHKLASLLLMEDIKHEQLLMLTFSRAAATEFKKRLIELIGNAANFVQINTFHSYCFDLLGRVGSLEKSNNVVTEAVEHILNNEVEISKITKSVLVIDEAQDMDINEYNLIKALIERNDDMRIIAVGDDDQNIYSFRGSDSIYMQSILNYDNSVIYELVENYRSKSNIVLFSNNFARLINKRIKNMEIQSTQGENGDIKITEYSSKNLIAPLIQSILNSEYKGSTCILTKTNDEALLITGILKKNGINAKLIQSNDKYNMYNLIELRYFIKLLNLDRDSYIIIDKEWENAKKGLINKFGRSENLDICIKLICDFEEINSKNKYVSDFMFFVKESSEDDFYSIEELSISVSTIHKSKGKEFDNVVIMLNDFQINKEEEKRQLYVGLTRAKENLVIHYNSNYFNSKLELNYDMIPNYSYKINNMSFPEVNVLVIQLGYKDVFLSFFKNKQNHIAELISGDEIDIDNEGCFNSNGERILKFSNKFKSFIKMQNERGYFVNKAKIKYILYWYEKETDSEIMILFPIVEFSRV